MFSATSGVDPPPAARRSARAQAKASGQDDPAGRPYRSFRGATVPVLAEPASTQRQAFDLIGAPIPLTLR